MGTAGSLRRWQVLASAAYYAVVWFLGLQSGLVGPTLGGIAEVLGEESGTALAPMFTCRAVGFLSGTLLVGVVFDTSPRQHVTLAIAAAGLAAGLATIPQLTSLSVYYALHVPLGVCLGFVDTGVNLLILDAWKGGNSTPAMNLLHFMWGVGSFMSPLLLTFLSVPSSFLVVAACGAASATLPLLLPSPATRNPHKLAERKAAQQQKQQKHARQAAGQDEKPDPAAEGGLFLLPTAGGFFMFFFYVGLEAGYGSWLATYMVEQRITDAEGAAIYTSCYWGALTAGRLLAVPIAVYVPPATLITMDLLGACISTGLFLLTESSAASLLVVSVAIGLSLASIFASTLAVAETRMPFTGRRASICIAGASSGEVVLPLLIGALFDRFGVRVFPACVFVFAALMCCSFAVLVTRPRYVSVDAADVAVEDGAKREQDEETEGLISHEASGE
jgi:fucose permease